MTVEQHDVIDFLAIDPSTHDPLLVISDHLPWENIDEHLFQLQEKLNAYLRFLESGEMIEKHPATRGRPARIEIVFEHEIPEAANQLIGKFAKAIEDAGFKLTWRAAT